LIPTEVIIIKNNDKYPGAIHKGYEDFDIQEMEINVRIIRYRRARWQLLDGTIVTEDLPEEYKNNHFGPELRSYVIAEVHHNRVPQDKVKQQLNDFGVDISTGQINAILINTAQELSTEKEEIFNEGKKSESVHVDDTGARNDGKNGFCTTICNELFTYMKSGDFKSRVNFLKILCGQDNPSYFINDDAIKYLELCRTSKGTYEWFLALNNTVYTEKEFEVLINSRLFSASDKKFIEEACLIGCCIANGLPSDLVIVSDNAGQFDIKIIQHALCWVHAERNLKKIIPKSAEEAADLEKILDLIWKFYRELKNYKDNPVEEQKLYLHKRFDEIMSTPTSGYQIAPALKVLIDNKKKLLVVLDSPSVDLNNNIAERSLRSAVIQRKISGGTRSEEGRLARDVYHSIFQTCKKNSISIWLFLKDRLGKKRIIPSLGQIIKERIESKALKKSVAVT
jgi:hypothetical protein